MYGTDKQGTFNEEDWTDPKAKQPMYMQNQKLWLNKLLGISWSMIPLEWSSLQFYPQWFLAQFRGRFWR